MGELLEDPNRQAVGLDPVWVEGTGGTGTDHEATPQATAQTDELYDPGDHTVAEVEEYLAEHPDEENRIRRAERKGKNRASLTGG